MDKQTVRERVWDALESEGLARFPFPPHGRIPNVAGAGAAADRLADLDCWARAGVLKANPDAPQLPVRRRALRDGKTVYMAVPRLREAHPFVALDPARIEDTDAAATVSSMDDYGVPVAPEEMDPVPLIVIGSVAVTEDGARVGKGEGYSDLEFAILRAFDLVSGDTTVVTTVHERQVVDDPLPVTGTDVPVDVVVTPERVIRTNTPYDRPAGIDWDALSEERLDEIPILASLRDSGR